MDEKQARNILGNWVQPNNALMSEYPFIRWHPKNRLALRNVDSVGVTESYPISVYQLEALVWWMRNKGAK